MSDNEWHCTSQYYSDYMADPRTRMNDIKKLGYVLDKRICRQHPYHKGKHSKEWRIVSYPNSTQVIPAPKRKQIVEHLPSGEVRISYVNEVFKSEDPVKEEVVEVNLANW